MELSLGGGWGSAICGQSATEIASPLDLFNGQIAGQQLAIIS